VGHDWGGFVAFLAALRAPERLSRLLALSIVHPWPRPIRPRLRTLPLLVGQGGEVALGGVSAGSRRAGPRFARSAARATGVRVDWLSRNGTGFVLTSGERRFEADNVLVAIGSWQRPRVPALAAQPHPGIVQLHSADYRNPGRLQDGDLLIVGAGHSGAEIALDAAGGRRIWLSGRDVGHLPFRVETFAARFIVPLVVRGVFHRLLTVRTPMGRKKRSQVFSHGLPLVRTEPSDLDAAGVERVSRVAGVHDGLAQLEDGRVLDVANVIWCSGFDPGLDWIDLPGVAHDDPVTEREIVAGPVLRRAAVPVRGVVGEDPRRGPRRGARRGPHRSAR